MIRRLALQNKVCYTTTLTGGEAFSIAIRHLQEQAAGNHGVEGQPITVRRLQDLNRSLVARQTG
jgi:hypothetical protein